MLKTLRDKVKKRTRHDIYVISFVSFCTFMLSAYYDLFEQFSELSRRYEHIELDELFTAIFISAISLSYFCYRRWQDVNVLSTYLEELTLISASTPLANRRALRSTLEQIDHQNNEIHSFTLISINGLNTIRNILGLVVVEHILAKLLTLFCETLTSKQLIVAWHSDQYIVHTPNPQQNDSEVIEANFIQVLKHLEQTCLVQLNVTVTQVKVDKPISEQQLIEKLERSLFND
ncbi:hypothetical protein PALB_23230 [Pseudoalteromonas luteoviolacea B = ATCC 29581]|nr:hypothetical protein PALB_23230 [Pseudoalteromonas luteoviolacea B = ATCC 29581]